MPKKDNDVLVFLSSTAHHKFKMYRKIAEEKGLRIHFLPVEMLYRSMAEGEEKGGSTEANSAEKTGIAHSAFTNLTRDKRRIIAKAINEIAKDLKLKRPVVILATDDAAVTFDKETWQQLPKKGASYVLRSLPDFEGPGAEFGPFVAARGGVSALVRDLREVGAKRAAKGREQAKTYTTIFSDSTTLSFQRLELNPSFTDFTFGTELETFTAESLSEIVLEESEKRGILPRSASPQSKVSPATIADLANTSKMGEELLHTSQRGELVESLARSTNAAKGKAGAFEHWKGKLKVALIGNLAQSAGFLERQIYSLTKEADVTKFTGDRLEELIAKNDGFVITCDRNTNPRTHVNYAVIINSMIVASQTDGRDFNKPIGLVEIIDPKQKEISALERITRIHKSISGMGMAKEGEYAKLQKFEGATVYYSNYFFYICADNQAAANNALSQVLTKEFQYYRKSDWTDSNVTKETRKNDIKPTERTVAIMCSAGNQNDELYEGAIEIAKFLASEGYNISDGAMDKYMGYGIIKGFEEGREEFKRKNPTAEQVPVLIGVSTPVLLGRETSQGRINDAFDVKITTPTLTRRTARILRPLDNKPADIVTILPGGIGTLVEKIQANLDNKGERKTPIIVWNPAFPTEQSRFYESVLKHLSPMVFHGMYDKKDDPEKLLNTKNPSEKAKKFRRETGMYIVNDIVEYKRVFKEISKELPPASRPKLEERERV